MLRYTYIRNVKYDNNTEIDRIKQQRNAERQSIFILFIQ
jgi:hypothetical protein